MPYAMDLMNHVRTVKDCAGRLGFEASVNALNFALDVRKGDLEVRFQPRFFFVNRETGERNLTYYVRPDARGFVGWLPYFNKVWPEALDKLAFKARCRENGLRTPDWWTAASPRLSDFIIKRKGGSLGIGMRGPYRSVDGRDPYHQLVEGEFYERFVEGRIAKIWFWNAHPVCMELLEFPNVTGNGRRDVRELIELRLSFTVGDFDRNAMLPAIESVVRYWGKTLDTVPAAGEKVTCGFSYSSLLERYNMRNRNSLVDAHGTPVAKQLAAIGSGLWEFVPQEIRRGMLFTVDAVLDAQGEFWLLEMNPNPGVHPDCYPAMLASVLNKDVSHMPSLSKPSPDAPHAKGGLVWSKTNAAVAHRGVPEA